MSKARSSTCNRPKLQHVAAAPLHIENLLKEPVDTEMEREVQDRGPCRKVTSWDAAGLHLRGSDCKISESKGIHSFMAFGLLRLATAPRARGRYFALLGVFQFIDAFL